MGSSESKPKPLVLPPTKQGDIKIDDPRNLPQLKMVDLNVDKPAKIKTGKDLLREKEQEALKDLVDFDLSKEFD